MITYYFYNYFYNYFSGYNMNGISNQAYEGVEIMVS